MSQAEAAAQLGSQSAQWYSDAERGALPDRDVRALLAQANHDDTEPSPGEMCALARRRSGTPLGAVCISYGASRTTYLERERGGESSVVLHWRERGFIF